MSCLTTLFEMVTGVDSGATDSGVSWSLHSESHGRSRATSVLQCWFNA